MPAQLGSGARFKALEEKLKKKGATDPAGLASYIGMRKYGKKKIMEMAQAGRK